MLIQFNEDDHKRDEKGRFADKVGHKYHGDNKKVKKYLDKIIYDGAGNSFNEILLVDNNTENGKYEKSVAAYNHITDNITINMDKMKFGDGGIIVHEIGHGAWERENEDDQEEWLDYLYSDDYGIEPFNWYMRFVEERQPKIEETALRVKLDMKRKINSNTLFDSDLSSNEKRIIRLYDITPEQIKTDEGKKKAIESVEKFARNNHYMYANEM